VSVAALILLCPLTVPGAVLVDGFFTEWKDMDTPGVRVGGGPDLTVELRCARDGTQLNLVVGVRDDRFTRKDTVSFQFGDDLELVIDPGDLEEHPARIRGIPGAKVDGATRPTGWLLEVGIPEAALRGKGWTPAGLQVSMVVTDDDGDGTNVGEGANDGEGADDDREEADKAPLTEHLRIRFPTGATNLEAWLHEASAKRFDHDRLVDIAGDGRPEWVLAVGNVLGVIGEGLGAVGMSGDVLPWSDQGRIVSIRGEDLDGDGTDEVWVEQQLTTDEVKQTVMYLYDWEDDGLSRLAAVELSNKGPGWKVHNTLTVRPPKPKGRKGAKKSPTPGWAKLIVKADRPKGVRETSYVDVDAGLDLPYQPLLLPWGFAKTATYEFESGRYIRVIKD
jgi:hypothetical protein